MVGVKNGERRRANYKSLDDFDARNKTILVRADLNVTITDGVAFDNGRIERSCQTLRELTMRGAKVVVLSHLGITRDQASSLRPVADILSRKLCLPVAFGNDCVGPIAASVVEALRPGDVALLENVRSHPGEERNDPEFAQQLAVLGDLYVNDAFSASHRAHASIIGVSRILPSAAGRLMQSELTALSTLLDTPQMPVAAIVGGAKLSTKLDLLGALVANVDTLMLGGAMANTFLRAMGMNVGASLCEADSVDVARRILSDAAARGRRVMVPIDVVAADSLKANAAWSAVAADSVPSDGIIVDVGPKTAHTFAAVLANHKTLLWNGPLGACETKPFDAGTNAVAQAAADLTTAGHLSTVAGGGDTAGALSNAGVVDRFSYVSMAGGAFLQWLEGKELPGITALCD